MGRSLPINLGFSNATSVKPAPYAHEGFLNIGRDYLG